MIRALTSLLCLLLASQAKAQDSLPDDLSWSALAALVVKVGPRTSQWSASEARAGADEEQAGKLDNPTLSYTGYGRTRGTSQAINKSQHQLQVEQKLPLWGERGLRRDEARAGRTAVRLENEAERASLLGEARARFVTLLFAQERVTRIEAASARMARQRGLIEGRVTAGFFSAYDLARAKLEESRLLGQLEAARADVVFAQGELAELVLRPGWSPHAVGQLEAPTLPAPRSAPAPGEQAAEARVAESAAHLRATTRERWPEVSLQVGAYFTTGGDSTSALGGLSMTLPTFDTGHTAVARARAAQSEAESTRDLLVLGRAARLEAALRELTQRQRAYQTFASQIPAGSAALNDMVEASYAGGRESAFVLIDTTRDLLALELEGLSVLEALVLCDARARVLAFDLRFE